jgi:VWFA-related protein
MTGTWVLSLVIASPLPQDFRFQLDVPRVYIDVFATRHGEAVGSLTRENFEVEDDGVALDFELVDAASVPQTFALLLDESGSISGRNREVLQQAALDFAGRLRKDDELTVLSFAERTTLRQPLRFERPEPAGRDYAIRGGGWTALDDALFLTMTYLRNAKGRPVLVVFSDGVDNASWINEEAVLETARTADIVVYAVRADAGGELPQRTGTLAAGGSSGLSRAMLDELARLTGGRTVEAKRWEKVSDTFREILSEVSTRYVLVFSPAADSNPGWHRLRVKVRGAPDVRIRARSGYFLSTEN